MPQDKPTILVVDDEPSVTDLLSGYLVEEGYNCVKTFSGEDALAELPTTPADLVLLDLRLPGISGMEVLRQMDSTHATPLVIVLTAVVDTETVIEAMKSGAVDYIIKPFKLEEVNDSIKRALDKLAVRKNERPCHVGSAKRRGDEPDWMVTLDCIAHGLKIRLELETRHAMIVVERTTAIALEMDIPEDYIARWAEARQRKITEEIEYLSSPLRKLEANPIAQVLLGTTNLHEYDPKEDHQN
ncbi:response regulator [Chloroflexota bacterium]